MPRKGHHRRPTVQLGRIPGTDIDPTFVCPDPDLPDEDEGGLIVLLPDGTTRPPGHPDTDVPGAQVIRPGAMPQPGITPGGGGPGGGPGGGGPGGGGPGGGGPGGGGPGAGNNPGAGGGNNPGAGAGGGNNPGAGAGGNAGGGGFVQPGPVVQKGPNNLQKRRRPRPGDEPDPDELLPFDPSRYSDLLVPMFAQIRDLADFARAHTVPCPANRRHRFGYPSPPQDVDVNTLTTVAAGASSPTRTVVASHTVKEGYQCHIRGFGFEVVNGVLTNSFFRVLRNGSPVTPWHADDLSYPPGGITPAELKECHIQLIGGDVLALEYGWTGTGNRDVRGRITGVEFAC